MGTRGPSSRIFERIARRGFVAGALVVTLAALLCASPPARGATRPARGATRPAQGASTTGASLGKRRPVGTPAEPPLEVLDVAPAAHDLGASGLSPIVVHFNAALDASSALPTISPSVPGTWARIGTSLVFRPQVAILPNTLVVVSVPAGVLAADGQRLARRYVWEYGTGSGSLDRVDEILAELGYLPVRFTPDQVLPGTRAAFARALWVAPAGHWAWSFVPPASLMAQWAPGSANVMLQGALLSFESRHNLPIGGALGEADWAALLAASLKPTAWRDPFGYTYALAVESSPETLTVFDDGKVVLSSPANTGISLTPTTIGTFFVYERLPSQVMQGTNPDGVAYADPVQYVAYFHGGEAIHYIYRAQYGFPQSLGCIELPFASAATAYAYLQLGTLVTVES